MEDVESPQAIQLVDASYTLYIVKEYSSVYIAVCIAVRIAVCSCAYSCVYSCVCIAVCMYLAVCM